MTSRHSSLHVFPITDVSPHSLYADQASLFSVNASITENSLLPVF